MFHDLDQYHLFLFDFDGLLVNTEEMHLEAYRQACREKNFSLHWSFDDFCNHAHYSATGMREGLSIHFPLLQKDDALWKSLYQSKTDHYMSFLHHGKVNLMPGVEKLLNSLLARNAKICIVTHSQKQMTDAIIKHQPLLQKLPHWITREDYKEPKPSPQGYLKAIERYLAPGEKVIGFEDSPRGLQSLMGTMAQPVWVTTVKYPELPEMISKGVLHYPTFETLFQI